MQQIVKVESITHSVVVSGEVDVPTATLLLSNRIIAARR
jgi:hypothetical protein